MSTTTVDEAVARHLERWAETTDRRMRAAHANRPAWNECRRQLFLEQLERDVPTLSETDRLAVLAAFEHALARVMVETPNRPALLLGGRLPKLVRDLRPAVYPVVQ